MSRKKSNWKDRQGIVYSTNEDFNYETSQSPGQATLPPNQQSLKVSLDKSGRAGKQVTLVAGFVGTPNDLEALTKILKTKCGTGGSSKDGEILVQGDVREKVFNLLTKVGYKVKRVG